MRFIGPRLYQLCTEPTEADFKDVLYHIPFVHPFRNGYLAFKLHKMRFGYDDFDSKNWSEVERKKKEVAKSSLSENFFEAGPQSVTQLVIGLSTGRFSPSVIIGILTSLFSLAWGASRAFFLERTEDETDPDPALFLVALVIFPLKLVVLTNSLIMWVLTAGLMGPWSLLTLPLIWASNLVSMLVFTNKKFKFGYEAVATEASDAEGSNKTRSPFLLAKAVLTAPWLPAVVGDHKNMYLVASITTLVSKFFVLSSWLVFAFSGLQQDAWEHPFILFCS